MLTAMTFRTILFFFAAILVIWAGNYQSSSALDSGRVASVLEHHNSPRRDGVYIDSTLTMAAASHFHIDPTFKATVPGAVYAQLLYFAGGPGGKDIVIAATETNN